MDDKATITSKHLLAVEGKDECMFFEALFRHLHMEGVQCRDIGGKDKFPCEFGALTINEGFPGLKRIGLVRDAETSPASSAYDSICHVLRKYNLPVPDKPGEIKVEGALRLGIYIMPDNTVSGMLENLCLKSIALQPANVCIDQYIQCCQKHQSEEEKSTFYQSKARVQVYLAARSPLVNSLGLGAQKGHWDFTHNCFDGIKDFIKRLFGG